jgi:hypothetical protein
MMQGFHETLFNVHIRMEEERNILRNPTLENISGDTVHVQESKNINAQMRSHRKETGQNRYNCNCLRVVGNEKRRGRQASCC